MPMCSVVLRKSQPQYQSSIYYIIPQSIYYIPVSNIIFSYNSCGWLLLIVALSGVE